LSLNQLAELIQRPLNGGYRTEYQNRDVFYEPSIGEELGNQAVSASYWVLMSRDVVPDSRSKTYDQHWGIVAECAAKNGALPYTMPKTLEAAVSLLAHHVRSGERLYSDSPWTYTRCEEKVNNNQWLVVVGGFSAAGLNFYVNGFGHNGGSVGVGVCACLGGPGSSLGMGHR
jgi:hypothetical protein